MLTSVVIAIGMQLFYNYVLKPRRLKLSQQEEKEESFQEPEQGDRQLTTIPEQPTSKESFTMEYQSR